MKVVKNYLYNVGYQIFVLIVPVITTPYITRTLGTNGVGINAYTNSILQYFVLVGSIGIGLYGNRTIAYFRDDKKKLSQTFWEISFIKLFTILISYLAFLIFLVFTNKYKIFYLFQSVQLLAVIFDISWFFMGLEDFKKTVIRNFLVKIISVIMIFVFVKSSSDVGNYILVLTLSTLIGNISLWGYLNKYIDRPDFKNLNLKKHLRPSLELFIPQIAIQVYLVLNKTMLGSMIGVESSGYYENSDKIVKLVLAIVTATGTVMLPRMANTFANNDTEKLHEYLFKSFDFVSFISFPLAFGVAAVAPKFSIWFMGEDFAITGSLISVMSIVIVMIAWSNVLGTQYLVPTGQNKKFTISVSGGAVVNLLTNILMISYIGTMGAVISTVISEVVVTLIQIYFIKDEIDIKTLFKGTWKYMLSGLLMFIPVRYLNNIMPGNAISILIQVIIGIIIYFLAALVFKFQLILDTLKYYKEKKE